MRQRLSIFCAPVRRPTSDAGFSLLEVLAVLVIIGLMSAAVVLSMRPPENETSSFRDELVLRLNQTAKESIYTGRAHALSVSQGGLHVMRYTNREWVIVRELPAEGFISMRLQIEDEFIELPEKIAPLILFEPTGDITDFQLNVRGFEQDINLFNAADGSVQIGTRT